MDAIPREQETVWDNFRASKFNDLRLENASGSRTVGLSPAQIGQRKEILGFAPRWPDISFHHTTHYRRLGCVFARQRAHNMSTGGSLETVR